jgi:hypothetical protein
MMAAVGEARSGRVPPYTSRNQANQAIGRNWPLEVDEKEEAAHEKSRRWAIACAAFLKVCRVEPRKVVFQTHAMEGEP